jgi:hypothetical protein
MKDFLLIFRTNYDTVQQRTPEQAEYTMKKWMDWIGSITAQDKLVNRGNRLQASGRVVKQDNLVINGPYTDIKESIGGYTIVKSESYDDAVEFAKSCPILSVGGNVEIREIDAA